MEKHQNKTTFLMGMEGGIGRILVNDYKENMECCACLDIGREGNTLFFVVNKDPSLDEQIACCLACQAWFMYPTKLFTFVEDKYE
jgi:hypothetical protein